MIDDIQYTSFPCPCVEELSSDPHLSHSGIVGDIITLVNIVIASVRLSSMKKMMCNGKDLQATSSSSSSSASPAATGTAGLEALGRPGWDPVLAAMGLQDGIHGVAAHTLRQ